jgi:hypothetical protein
MRRMSGLLMVLGLLVGFVGCGGDSDGTTGPVAEVGTGPDGVLIITLAQISEQIFVPKCIACHGGGSPSANMSLEPGAAAAAIINVASSQRSDLKRVDPGNPGGSYLLIKLRGADGILNSQMPLSGPPLTDEQIALVVQWIVGGAIIE